jgi:hypothetical protein
MANTEHQHFKDVLFHWTRMWNMAAVFFQISNHHKITTTTSPNGMFSMQGDIENKLGHMIYK